MPRIEGTYQSQLMVFALESPEPRELAKWLARLYPANVLDDPWPVLVAQLRGYGATSIELGFDASVVGGLKGLVELWTTQAPYEEQKKPPESPLTEEEQRVQAFMDAPWTTFRYT